MSNIAGLQLVTPSSVSGSGVSLSGAKITFSAATSISVNGVFTSSYVNYLTVMRVRASVSGTLIVCNLRASGTDATAANYWHQYLAAGGSSIGAARFTAASNYRVLFASANMSGAHVWFYGPNEAANTASKCTPGSDASGNQIYDTAATHMVSSAYDGFTFSVGSNNISGSMTVYGLSQ